MGHWQDPGDACPASFNNLTSSRICPANERQTSGKEPERPYANSSLPGHGSHSHVAPRDHETRVPPRRSSTGRRVDPVGLRSGADQQPRDHGVGIPHVARVQLVSAPHGRRYERHQVEYPLGTFRVGCDADRALDRLARIGDRSTAPSADLVAEQPEPPGPSGPNRALGDDAASGPRWSGIGVTSMTNRPCGTVTSSAEW
jgi:hypothetical protein